ncbi:MAG: hypothetical protein BGO98_34750 [Myxococcales bacterium 68-20]|nr:MAG: hypothetical protein BGO98_34750 [Myxococcales bacterium 68-20]
MAVVAIVIAGCARVAAPPGPSEAGAVAWASTNEADASPVEKTAALADAGVVAPPVATQIDPDGNDDDEEPGTGKLPEVARWEKVGTPPLALTRICDLTPFRGALYAAHANQPLGTDGATITRYEPSDTASRQEANAAARRPFRVAFDWNRPGEPVKGGGAGQGFLRVRAIGGRLFVPDADPPYGGLGVVDWGTEGYVFVSNDKGVFAPPRAPNFKPPGFPDLRAEADPRAGAGVLPRAYHVIDVIRYRGALYASTGSVPPKERAWSGPSPGALHRASEDGSRWTYEVDYPYPWKDGVWRLTYLVRFKDRLYAGIQDYAGRDPNDFVVFTPDASAADAGSPTTLRREDARPTRITRAGASGTLRWWVDTRASPPRLYWLAWTRDGIVLRVTIDGDNWAAIDLPEGAGSPTDVTRFRDAVVVLTTQGLYRIDGAAIDGPADIAAMSGVADAAARLIAPVEEVGAKAKTKTKTKSPFEVTDFFCTAPLAVMNDVLYAGGQRGGTLYRLIE